MPSLAVPVSGNSPLHSQKDLNEFLIQNEIPKVENLLVEFSTLNSWGAAAPPCLSLAVPSLAVPVSDNSPLHSQKDLNVFLIQNEIPKVENLLLEFSTLKNTRSNARPAQAACGFVGWNPWPRP